MIEYSYDGVGIRLWGFDVERRDKIISFHEMGLRHFLLLQSVPFNSHSKGVAVGTRQLQTVQC